MHCKTNIIYVNTSHNGVHVECVSVCGSRVQYSAGVMKKRAFSHEIMINCM